MQLYFLTCIKRNKTFISCFKNVVHPASKWKLLRIKKLEFDMVNMHPKMLF